MSLQERKAQVALYVLIGFIILVSVILFLFMTKKEPSIESVYTQTNDIRTAAQAEAFITDCFTTGVKEIVPRAAVHGGYLSEAPRTLVWNGESIGLPLRTGSVTNSHAGWAALERELRNDVETRVQGCIQRVETQTTISVTKSSDPNVTITSDEAGLHVAIDLELTLQSEGVQRYVSRLETSGASLETAYRLAERLVTATGTETPLELVKPPEGFTVTEHYKEGFIIHEITSDDGLRFLTATELPVEKLPEVPKLVGMVGEEFQYDFNPDGAYTVTLEPHIIPVGEDGSVHFTPSEEDLGVQQATLSRVDTTTGKSVEQKLTVIILRRTST